MDVAQRVAERRPAYLAALAGGTERFHEPRRADCPWCGSPRLRIRLRTADLIQHKPGTFTLDRCGNCAHSFQNPRLTPEGLDFYRRDVRETLSGKAADTLLGAPATDRRHLARARALREFDEPECWLDVGTGRARFPALAKQVLPYTSFDGLDPGQGVVNAVRSGRIEEGHRGTLAGLADALAGRYDALSLFHQLERSPDPRAELGAARTALRPGGHLMIEATDPDCRYARLLGKWWPSYAQPRHLHLVPLANLREELERLGFTVVGVERRAAHVPADLSGALALLLNRCLPKGDVPWRARPAPPLRLKLRRAAWWACVPALALAHALDRLLAPLLTHAGFANTYRVVARRGADG
ncbi:methyltransferase domain-containing protein [Streptomyces sp. BG9H]|uniref:Methyltransferase domain-containing protein n=1 Tax=Streptomyces anatolicus TaxID=2675858 RepID=A0ABS6YK67_9ACTN|nr:class I SAM-dependent methyltransferase [Streptomyces anatolicus]MBW5421793.1 methyltransferase domain-containing protein [Streptomyces anatolicus]